MQKFINKIVNFLPPLRGSLLDKNPMKSISCNVKRDGKKVALSCYDLNDKEFYQLYTSRIETKLNNNQRVVWRYLVLSLLNE